MHAVSFEKSVDLPWGELQEVVQWCQTHCQNDWTFAMLQLPGMYANGKYVFKFESEKDYINFVLWQN